MLTSKSTVLNRLTNLAIKTDRKAFTSSRSILNSGKTSKESHRKDLEQLTRHIRAQQDKSWTPSLRVSLGILGITIFSVSGYTSYQVFYKKKPVFLPLWITSTHRRLYSTEANRDELIQLSIHRLQERVCIDPVVTEYLGLGATIDENDLQNSIKIVVHTRTPGITGFSIHPTGKWGLAWKAFAQFKPNNDSGPLAAEGMSSESDGDQSLDPEKVYRPRMPKTREAIVEGTVNLKASSLASNAYVKSAAVKFTASHDLDLPAEAPSMTEAVLIYKINGQEKSQKLW